MSCADIYHRTRTSKYCPDCGDQLPPPPIRIHHLSDLQRVAEVLGVRPDWHEPDEQEVTAKVFGWCFDNAGFWPNQGNERLVESQATEMYVELYQAGELIALVNLATLFAMAARTHE